MGVIIKRAVPPPGQVSLPEEVSVPSNDFGNYTTLLYGEKKIGKTTLCAQFPNAFFLFFEPGGKALAVKQRPVTHWLEFINYLKLLKENPDYCDTIIIDTADMAYEKCFAYVCKTQGFAHPSDEGYGKGWSAIKDEFKLRMNELLSLGKGVVVTSHAQSATFKRQNGLEYNKMVPTVPNQAASYITGVMDNLMYYGYYGSDRFMTIQGSDALEAGTRCLNNFFVKGTYSDKPVSEEHVHWERVVTDDEDNDSWEPCDEADEGAVKRVTVTTRRGGMRVHSIPAGNSPGEAYDNLQKAFRNEQATDGKPEVTRTGLSETKVSAMTKGRK